MQRQLTIDEQKLGKEAEINDEEYSSWLTGLFFGKSIQSNNTEEINFLYRGDTQEASEIFNTGFKARGNNANLVHHALPPGGKDFLLDSKYISTSTSAKIAETFPRDLSPEIKHGFLYEINPQKKGVDVATALLPEVYKGEVNFEDYEICIKSEKEIAIPDKINPHDIKGAWRIEITSINEDGIYREYVRTIKKSFIPNPSYIPPKSGIQTLLTAGKALGHGITGAAIALDAISLTHEFQQSQQSGNYDNFFAESARVAGGWSSAIILGKTFAEASALACAPFTPYGPPVCGLIGGAVGSILGYWGGGNVTKNIMKSSLGCKEKNAQLLDGAANNNIPMMQEALRSGADINTRDSNAYQFTPLHWAACRGHTKVVEFLASNGADLDALDSAGRWTPFMQAARNNHNNETMESLIRFGADINIRDKDGYNARYIALINHYPTEAHFIAQDKKLLEGAANNNIPIMQEALRSGADVNIRDQQDHHHHTALCWAAIFGHKEAVDILLSHGANPNITNEYQWLPISQAIVHGHNEIVDKLIAAGTNLLARYPQNDIAPRELSKERNPITYEKIRSAVEKNSQRLIEAAKSGNMQEMKRALSHGADVNIRDQQDHHHHTALCWAAIFGHEAIIDLLLSHGANPNLSNQYGWLSIHQAIEHGHNEIVDKLIAAGTNLLARYPQNDIAPRELSKERNPIAYEKIRSAVEKNSQRLIEAAKSGNMQEMKRALSHGADVNIRDQQDHHHHTALCWAAIFGHKEAVDILLSHGANPNITNEYQWLPISQAIVHGHNEIVDKLIAAGTNLLARYPQNDIAPRELSKERNPIAYEKIRSAVEKNSQRLIEAAKSGNMQEMKRALSHGADVNIRDQQDHHHHTALCWAAIFGHEAIIDLLLSHGANPNLSNQYGWLSIHQAIEHGHNRIVQKLVAAGSNLRARCNDRNMTPYELARDRKNIEAFEIISIVVEQHNQEVAEAADYYYYNDQFTEALNALNELCILKGELTAQGHRMRGDCYRKLSRDGDAMVEYNKAIDMEPHNFDHYYHFVTLFFDRGQYQDCINLLNKYLGLEPNDSNAKSTLNYYESFYAEKLYESGHHDTALEYARRCLARDAAHPLANGIIGTYNAAVQQQTTQAEHERQLRRAGGLAYNQRVQQNMCSAGNFNHLTHNRPDLKINFTTSASQTKNSVIQQTQSIKDLQTRSKNTSAQIIKHNNEFISMLRNNEAKGGNLANCLPGPSISSSGLTFFKPTACPGNPGWYLNSDGKTCRPGPSIKGPTVVGFNK